MTAAPDFRLLFESAPGLYLVLDPELSIVAVSDAYLTATRTRREEILGRGIFHVFPDNPDDQEATGVANLRASLARVLNGRIADAMAVQKYDIRRPQAEGGGFEERYWSPQNSPVFDAEGSLAYIVHRVVNVTEFVRLGRQASEQRQVSADLATRVQAMDAEIMDRSHELQQANERLRLLHARLEERVRARTADLHRANSELRQEMAQRQKAEDALHRSEEQLRQAQKLEAVGRLAGGIAHDFNNLLSVILSYSSMLLSDLAPGHPMRADLQEIEEAGARAATLTRQLLAFSRQQVLEVRTLDVNAIVSSLHKMLARLLGEDIELKLSLAAALLPVRVDRGQLEQVIMNLVVNARDAMPRGGRLALETCAVHLDAEYAREHVEVQEGPHACLVVSDSGVGMDRATQARIFEPFFTTKERGKGTGLGLATVFGIVKQSGGHIWVYSEPGAGTTFKIYLPQASGEVERERPPSQRPLEGQETILLVEDEHQVRAAARDILHRYGYSVLAVSGPAEALATCKDASLRFELLLTDVVMPSMNGHDLAHAVRAIRPGLPVVFMSGHTDDIIAHHGLLEAGVVFVQKPLTPGALVSKVREALDG